MTSRLWGTVGLAVAVTVVLGLYVQGIDAPPEGGAGGGRRAVTVAVAPVAVATVVDSLQVTGTVKARESVSLTAETAGLVREVLFEDGAEVAAGVPLLRLEAGEETAERAAARAALTQAERAYDRAAQLRDNGTVAPSVFDQAAAAVEAARAALAVAEARLAERTVTAPFAGRLGFREVSPGAYLQPGQEITTLDDLSRVHVDFTVAERHLPRLHPGLAVRFAPAGAAERPEAELEAHIASVAPRVDPLTRQARVRATLDNPRGRLRPGQLVVAEVALSEHPGVVVPATAVVSIGHQHFAYVIGDDGQARRREVALGWRGDGRLEVVSGLATGERLVIEGAAKLDDGAAVTVVPSRAVAPSAD
jgi:membrane fusion protein (multidrug efflux system)